MKIPQAPNFKIIELVPKRVYEKYADNSQFLISLFNEKALITLQALRNRFGPTTVNDWHINPNGNQYRGYRELECHIGAKFSQHKLGNAFDCYFKDTAAKQARQYILDHPEEFPFITAIEGKVNWLHFDVRPATWVGIKVFNP